MKYNDIVSKIAMPNIDFMKNIISPSLSLPETSSVLYGYLENQTKIIDQVFNATSVFQNRCFIPEFAQMQTMMSQIRLEKMFNSGEVYRNLMPLNLDVYKITTPAISIPQISLDFSEMTPIRFSYNNTAFIHSLGDVNNDVSSNFEKLFKNSIMNIEWACDVCNHSPLLAWLQTIQNDLFLSLINTTGLSDSVNEYYKEKELEIGTVLYECKWFPGVWFIGKWSLLKDITYIITSSRGNSKRRENRIDKVILGYFTKTEIDRIRKGWRKKDLPFYIKKALSQTIDAYYRKEYALTIPFLATMWEGIIKSKMVQASSKQTEQKKSYEQLVKNNHLKDILNDFYQKMIYGSCYSVNEVISGVPNRNAIAHGWYTNYPSQKEALNAILFTDFVLNLEKLEEHNGQTKNENGGQSR